MELKKKKIKYLPTSTAKQTYFRFVILLQKKKKRKRKANHKPLQIKKEQKYFCTLQLGE